VTIPGTDLRPNVNWIIGIVLFLLIPPLLRAMLPITKAISVILLTRFVEDKAIVESSIPLVLVNEEKTILGNTINKKIGTTAGKNKGDTHKPDR
jgi:hypothetical protein